MSKFIVYVFQNEKEYGKAKNLYHKKRFSDTDLSNKMHPDHGQLDQLLEYCSEKKEFFFLE